MVALSRGTGSFQGLVDGGYFGSILGSRHLLLRVFLSRGFLSEEQQGDHRNGGSWVLLVVLLS